LYIAFNYCNIQKCRPRPTIKPAVEQGKKPFPNTANGARFPKVHCLLQYVSNGNHYGRIQGDGKLICAGLKAPVLKAPVGQRQN